MTGLRIVPSVATDLIERLENAVGADRELDAEIAAAVGTKSRSRRTAAGKNKGREWMVDTDVGGIEFWSHHPPAFTASLDAAVTLIPAHCAYEVRRTITLTCSATVYGQDTHADTQGATTALALCIASLRARNGA